jgi:hypothetical protein
MYARLLFVVVGIFGAGRRLASLSVSDIRIARLGFPGAGGYTLRT